MNNRLFAGFFVGVLALILSASAGATLFDRGGGMIYDDVLNITWLQDANYALTSGYPSWNGRMQFDEANAWAAQLVYGGYSDWRLPRVKPINGSTFTGPVFSYDGSTDYAYNISYPGRINPPDPPGAYPYSTQNEIAYMFYVNLGNLAKYRTDGTPRSGTSGIDFGMVNTSFVDGATGKTVFFKNLYNYLYWTETEVNAGYSFCLWGHVGFMDINGRANYVYAWAVRDGDVVVTPPNLPPTVSITSPADGAKVTLGQSFILTANANDTDGTVTKVAYYANGMLIGTQSTSPYTLSWTPGAVGSYALTAVATDNNLATGTSAAIDVTVDPVVAGTTVVLQRGLNGYAGASDTYLDNVARTSARGSATSLLVQTLNYNPLIRFAIFQSEGGPVPNDAVIQSATLALYKQYYDDPLRLNALLRPWIEGEATWTNASIGVPWAVGGAAGAGTDYRSAADALVTPNWNPGWVTFDVTPRVQQWASGGANYGWRMAQASGGANTKQFNSSEYTTAATLRPKLTIIYSGGTPNVPPTVNITSPADGAKVTLGQSFILTASANDPGGTVTKVDYYANGVAIGTQSTSPYTLSWTPSAIGSYALTAVATDNGLATGTSAAINVTVDPVVVGTTVVLQRGLNGYSGASDTYLDNVARTTARGGATPLLLQPVNYNPLIRFAIFQSEGGPVPNGSTILSATLALYKQYYNDTIRVNALLRPWVENQATWTVSQTGVAWAMGGAAGAGTDYSSAADALVTPNWNPGWVTFDVTPRVQQWASGGANYGWRIAQTNSGANNKQFNSSEFSTDTTLRPKLTVIYQ